MNTLYTFSLENWSAYRPGEPLTYSFAYSEGNGKLKPVMDLTSTNVYTTQLPAGKLTVYGIVVDSFGGITTVSTSLIVTDVAVVNPKQELADLKQRFEDGFIDSTQYTTIATECVLKMEQQDGADPEDIGKNYQ